MENKLKLPPKLYGRDRLLSQLLSSFTKASRGYGEIVFVPGHSGVGKTSLVQSLKEPVLASNGFFVEGKFDQFHQVTPYYAIGKALSRLWQKLQEKESRKIEILHENLRNTIGELGSLLIDLVPDTARAFETLSQIEEIPAGEARHRFARVIRSFLEISSQPEHPTVLFIDDWQWADTSSIELLKQLQVDESLRYFLLVASFRNEEVGKNHPLSSAIIDLSHQTRPPLIIPVENLKLSEVKELIADTLTGNISDFENLADLVLAHTQGNPFYVRAFLEYLDECKTFSHEQSTNSWYWDISKEKLPEDIVEIFMHRLREFDRKTQVLLSLAACLGNRFSIADLAVISKIPADTCRSVLKKVIDKDLLLPVDDLSQLNTVYRFFHDRVQQAAFLLIDKLEYEATRLSIGRLLLENLPEVYANNQLFEILEHLNAGSPLMESPEEINRLIELNMSAAQKAKAATAYGAMQKFNRFAFSFVERLDGGVEAFWQNDYEKALVLYRNLGESEFLEGDINQAETHIRKSLEYIKSPIERAETLRVLIVNFTLLARYPEAIESGRQALSELGILLPDDNYEKYRDEEIQLFRRIRGDRSIRSFAATPIMADPEKKMAVKLLITMGPPCYRTHQRLWSVLVPKVVNLTFQHGLMPQIGYAYTAFGGLLGWVENDYDTAKEFADLAEDVMTRLFESPSDQSVFYLMVGSSARHWFKHLDFASRDYQRAFEIGLQSGNLQYAAYAFGHNMYCRFFQALPLKELVRETHQSLLFSKSRLNQWAIDLLQGGLLIFEKLETKPADINSLFSFDDQAYLDEVESHANIQVLCIYRILKSLYCLLMGNLEAALEFSKQADELLSTVATQGLLPWPEHIFIRLMILTGLYNDADKDTQAQWREEIHSHIEQLHVWNRYCPENYLHKLHMASAEQKRIEGDLGKAMQLYDKSIKAASKNGYLHWELLANERMSTLCSEYGNFPLAQFYWQQAYFACCRWGAEAKAALMEKTFFRQLDQWHQGLTDRIPKNNLLPPDQAKSFFQSKIEAFKEQTAERLHSLTNQNVAREADELAAASERLRQEIVKRQQIEEALTQSEQRYRAFLDNLRTGVVAHSPDTSILYCNPMALNLLGLTYDQMFGSTAFLPQWKFISEDGHDLHLDDFPVNRAIRSTTPINDYIIGIVKPDDAEVTWVSCSSLSVAGRDGEVEQILISFSDTTERKNAEKYRERAQRELEQAKKMQAVGTLAGGIAHEFNNLLGIIMGCTDMARDEVPMDSFAKAQLDRVMKASYRVKDLVKQILTFSRQSQQKKLSANLCSLVKESVKLIQSSIPSSVEIKTNINSACGNSIVDPTEIQQIVMNFCSNAVWAMKEKGTLTISLNEIHLTNHDELIPKGLSAGSYVQLSFSDTGCGMDKETLSRIFDPFFTTKEVGQGTGMGLSIVYAITESYGGTITVESEVGKGTTFYIYFPVTIEPVVEKSEQVEEIPKGTERILFVDDEEMYAEMGSEMVGRLGYAVDLKFNSKEALELFKADPNKYDLVITDQIMPNLSGEELVKEIRSVKPDMPIILCTGYSTQMDEKKAKSLGINAFAFKPIAKKDIAKLIRKVLDA